MRYVVLVLGLIVRSHTLVVYLILTTWHRSVFTISSAFRTRSMGGQHPSLLSLINSRDRSQAQRRTRRGSPQSTTRLNPCLHPRAEKQRLPSFLWRVTLMWTGFLQVWGRWRIGSTENSNIPMFVSCHNNQGTARQIDFPSTVLNDQPFTDEFKAYDLIHLRLGFPWSVDFRRITQLTSAPVHFGLIAPEVWNQPDWIDEAKASAAREDMMKNSVIYGGMLDVSRLFQNANL